MKNNFMLKGYDKIDAAINHMINYTVTVNP